MPDETPDYSSGVMLCLRPDDPEDLTIPGGIEASDIHCTLFYFGTTNEWGYSPFEQAKEVIGGEVLPHAPIEGTVTAWSEFGEGGDSTALVLLVDAPGLAEFRTKILRHLRPALGEDHQPYQNHDFLPHITVAYGPNESDIEAAKALVGHPLHFEVLELEWGTEPHQWDLEDDDDPDDAISDDEMASGLLLEVEASVLDPQEKTEMAEATDTVVEDESAAPAQKDVDATDTSTEILESFEVRDAVEFAALPPHSTPTTDSRTFSGDQVKVRTRSGETPAYYGRIYAWRDSGNSPGNKTGYKFPHHIVDEAGNPGAAVTWAVHAALMLVDDAQIPANDRRGVYNHLAGHLRDAGVDVPPLGSDNASAEDITAAVSLINETLADDSEFQEFAAAYSLCPAFEQEDAPVDTPITAATEFNLASLADTEILGELVRRWVESAADKVTPVASDGEEFDVVAEAEEITKISAGKYDWAGIIIPEGVPSGDGRMIDKGALTWRPLPLPLMLQTVNDTGHKGSVIAGSIAELERVGDNIVGRGYFDPGPDGQRLKALLANKTMRGVSADIDSVMIELRTADGTPVTRKQLMESGDEGIRALEVIVEGRLIGATACPFPAFFQAELELVSDPEDALVASGFETAGEIWRSTNALGFTLKGEEGFEIAPEAVVASAGVIDDVTIPINPPAAWFALQDMPEPMPFTVFPDGRIFGLLAQFGTCHIGARGRCVDVPRSSNNYSLFRNKSVLSTEGDMIATGPIIMDTVHPSLKLRASDATAFYAHSGCAVADVAVYENEHGIVVAGALRPDVEPERIRALRGSSLSGDWRRVHGQMELVGVLAVNVPGFPVHGLVASGTETETLEPRGLYNSVTGEVESLVAAGSMVECYTCGGGTQGFDTDALVAVAEQITEQKNLIAELFEIVRPIRTAQLAERIAATFGTDTSDNGAKVLGDETTEAVEGEQA